MYEAVMAGIGNGGARGVMDTNARAHGRVEA